MGGSQSSQTSVERQLDQVIENRCGSVVCKATQNASFEVGAGGKIQGVSAKQRCSAKLACAFDALASDKASAELTKSLAAGAGTTGSQDSVTSIKEKLSKKVLNDCGSAMSEQQQNLLFKGGQGAEISDISLDQAGDAQLTCAAKTLLSSESEVKVKEEMKQEGFFDGINAIFKGIGMLPLIVGIVVIFAILFAPQVLMKG